MGRVTSGGYGYTVEKSIAYAYLPAEHEVGTEVAVEIFGEWVPGVIAEEPLFDPRGRADPRVTFAAEVERVWPGRGASFEVLGGGITNHNLKVEVDGERFVLRVAGKDTGLLGIDRTVELAATQAAAALGIGPEVVEFVEPEGWLVTRFVEGEIPALERMREPAMLEPRRPRPARVPRRRPDPGVVRLVPRRRELPADGASTAAAACRMRTTGRTRWRRGSRRRARRTPPFRATTTC